MDTDTQLITAVAVLPGHAPDNLGAWNWLRCARPHRCAGGGSHGGPAYGDGATRQTFAHAGLGWWPGLPAAPTGSAFARMTLSSTWPRAVAPVRPGHPRHCCPRGSGRMALHRFGHPRRGPMHACPRSQCISAKGRKGRRAIHPQEALEEARALQQSAGYYLEYRARRWWWNTGWPDWCSWAFASPASVPRRDSSCTWATVA